MCEMAPYVPTLYPLNKRKRLRRTKSPPAHTKDESTKAMADIQDFPIEMINREVRLPESFNAFYLEPPQIILTSCPNISKHDIITTAVCWTLGGLPPSVKKKTVIVPEKLKAALNQAINCELSDQMIIFVGMASLITLGRVRIGESVASLEYFLERWQMLCTKMGTEDVFASNKVPHKRIAEFIYLLESWQQWSKPQTSMRRHLLEMAMQKPNANSSELVKQALLQVKIDFESQFTCLMDIFIDSGSQAMTLPTITQQAINFRGIITQCNITLGERYQYLKAMELEGEEQFHYKKYGDLLFATLSAGIYNKQLDNLAGFLMMRLQIKISKMLIYTKAYKTFTAEEIIEKSTISKDQAKKFLEKKNENGKQNINNSDKPA